MKFVSLFIFLLYSTSNVAQNQLDKAGKRKGLWVYYGKDRPRSHYPKEAKIEEGYYINGFKEGVWIKYYPDGRTKKLVGNYVNNRPMGMYTRYYSNGKIMEKGNFSYKNFTGPYARYHQNGKLAYRCTFNKEGHETGLIQHYHENGNIALEFTSKDGQPTGKLTRYYENGSIKEVLNYNDNGKLASIEKFNPAPSPIKVTNPTTNKALYPPKVLTPNTHGIQFDKFGNNRLYNENEAIWMDGLFKNGQLWDGQVYEYDEDGILIKVKVFKKGKYYSDGQL